VKAPAYRSFRSGLTFEDVRRELAAEQQAQAARGERMYVTRRTVLGRWRQHKQAAYEYQYGEAAG
jgi:hypothetical protein